MVKIKTQYGQPANYNVTPATRADGQGSALEVDVSGRLITANYSGAGTTASQELGAYQTVTLQNAATATGNGTAIELSGMGALGLVVTGTFVGTITFETRDPVGNWSAAMVQAQGTTSPVLTATTTGVFHRPTSAFSAFRARISAYTSGSITVTAFAENTAYMPVVQNIGMYERLDATNDEVTNRPYGHSTTIISTATTTTIKTGAGVIHSILVLGGTLGNVTGYDNTAGSGTVNIPTVTPVQGQKLAENELFSTGYTIVTAAATLLKVVWR